MAEQYKDDSTVTALNLAPGIKRDGTLFDGRFARDGLWCRWRNGRPKKMGGYRQIENGFDGPVRAVLAYGLSGLVRTFLFSGNGVQYVDLDFDCNGSAPAVVPIDPGFVPDPLFTWQYDTIFDSSGGPTLLLVAHASRYLADITDTTEYPFYYGAANTPSLANPGSVSVSGGLTVLQPYLFLYGNNGLIKNSAANDVTDFVGGDANEVNVSGTKIVRGYPVRGGGNAPAGVFWSLQEVIRVNFVGGATLFKYDIVTGKSSILSPNGVVEYDGVFYWAGIDRFLLYNGIVKEVPNQMNADFFFDNLNIAQRCKIWATAVPRWGEIWWFFCKDSATEPNHAVVYNVREQTWYDTPILRSAGYLSQILRFPLWTDSEPDVPAGSTYALWQQEFGTDRIVAPDALAIDSYFETCDLGLINGDPVQGDATPGANNNTETTLLEPDFVQTGPMTVEFFTKKYAHSPAISEVTKTFDPTTEVIEARVNGRLTTMKFRSNVAGGDYMMGKVLWTPNVSDPRK